MHLTFHAHTNHSHLYSAMLFVLCTLFLPRSFLWNFSHFYLFPFFVLLFAQSFMGYWCFNLRRKNCLEPLKDQYNKSFKEIKVVLKHHMNDATIKTTRRSFVRGRRLIDSSDARCYLMIMCSQYNTIQYSTIQYNTVQYNAIQYNTIQHNTIQYNKIQWNTDNSSYVIRPSSSFPIISSVHLIHHKSFMIQFILFSYSFFYLSFYSVSSSTPSAIFIQLWQTLYLAPQSN